MYELIEVLKWSIVIHLHLTESTGAHTHTPVHTFSHNCSLFIVWRIREQQQQFADVGIYFDS
jgi:hypothetical protein